MQGALIGAFAERREGAGAMQLWRCEERLRESALAIISHVESDGYMVASNTHAPYGACWFRDTSFCAMALARIASHLSSDDETRQKAMRSALTMLRFMWGAAGGYAGALEAGGEADLRDDVFKTLRNHLPARVGNGGGYFKTTLEDGSRIDDSAQHMEDSWLRQYDSVPLLLLATAEVAELAGTLHGTGADSRMLNLMARYMAHTYITPCANAWESETDKLHAYSVAAVAAGLRHGARIASWLGADSCRGEMLRAAAGADAFLERFFVREGILYRCKPVFDSCGNGFADEPVREPDAALIFVFSRFKPRITSYDAVRRATLAYLDGALFGGEALPIRFLHDTYFDGYRWPMLGLEFARHYAETGDIARAGAIIRYVERRYMSAQARDEVEREIAEYMRRHYPWARFRPNGDAGAAMLPEGELINTAHPGRDAEQFLARHGGPIRNLAWSWAAYAEACIALYEAMRRPCGAGSRSMLRVA